MSLATSKKEIFLDLGRALELKGFRIEYLDEILLKLKCDMRRHVVRKCHLNLNLIKKGKKKGSSARALQEAAVKLLWILAPYSISNAAGSLLIEVSCCTC